MSQAWPEMEEQTLPAEFAHEEESIKITGFWMFLVTDVLIFASLFSLYAVYAGRMGGEPNPATFFHLGPALAETLLLLTSSFTVGLAIWFMRRRQVGAMTAWLVATLVLGATFVAIEAREFLGDIQSGYTWHQSAFLSAFFTLVGTHGAHVTFGILMALTLLIQVARRGLTPVTARKLYTFSLYWHFLDVVWIFIYSVVYLGGRLG
ncbi:MAG: cytochrome c oxidase subunit 3 [Firmicutes bacterium]|nr:cytochrome c oxidase subunit 3 [Alicyclobacillaceae bacterium]MCL6497704.1 cytochrome c oxidase subunit 3 [Bacillota bacterium]